MKSANSDLFSYALVLYAVGAIAAVVLPLQLNEENAAKQSEAETVVTENSEQPVAELAECETAVTTVATDAAAGDRPVVSAAVDKVEAAPQPCTPATRTASDETPKPPAPVLVPAVSSKPADQAL